MTALLHIGISLVLFGETWVDELKLNDGFSWRELPFIFFHLEHSLDQWKYFDEQAPYGWFPLEAFTHIDFWHSFERHPCGWTIVINSTSTTNQTRSHFWYSEAGNLLVNISTQPILPVRVVQQTQFKKSGSFTPGICKNLMGRLCCSQLLHLTSHLSNTCARDRSSDYTDFNYNSRKICSTEIKESLLRTVKTGDKWSSLNGIRLCLR